MSLIAQPFSWIDQAPIALAVVNNAFRFVAANQQFRALCGRSAAELQTCTYGDISNAKDLAAEIPIWLQAFAGKHDSILHKRFVQRDGTIVTASLLLCTVPGDAADHCVLVHGTACVDARERTDTAAQLDAVRLYREMRDIAAFAGHDLREQMRMVTSFLGILTAQKLECLDERQRNFLAQAVSHSARLNVLLTGLVHYARASMEATAPATATCDSALDAALGQLAGVLDSHQAVVTRQALPNVAVDAGALTGVFLQLIENALVHRGEHAARIDISGAHSDQEWIISVTDAGPGIANDIRTMVFKPFFSTLAAPPHNRLGLGLALCHSAVERHGGRIWLDAAVREGTTVSFALPDPIPYGLQVPTPVI